MYKLIDLQTGATVSTYQTRQRANKRGDAMNAEHGSHRYSVQLTDSGRARLRAELGLAS